MPSTVSRSKRDKAHFVEGVVDAEGAMADLLRDKIEDLPLNLVFRRLHVDELALGLRERALVDLLVLVQRNLLDLHRHRRHHVGRLLGADERVHGLDVDLRVADHVGRYELAARRPRSESCWGCSRSTSASSSCRSTRRSRRS